MLEKARLYFIPSRGEFLKIQPGTGDNLSPEDIEAGFTDYVIWNRFRPGPLDIDGELEMECIDSGMVMLEKTEDDMQKCLLRDILEQAYEGRNLEAIRLTTKQI